MTKAVARDGTDPAARHASTRYIPSDTARKRRPAKAKLSAGSMYWCLLVTAFAAAVLYFAIGRLLLPAIIPRFADNGFTIDDIALARFLFLLCGCVVALFSFRRSAMWQEELGLVYPRDGRWIPAVTWTLLLLAIEAVIFGVLYLCRHSMPAYQSFEARFGFDFVSTPLNSLGTIPFAAALRMASAIVLAPLFHELCFRGIGIGGYVKNGSWLWAVVTTAFVGALVFGFPAPFPIALVSAFIYGIVRMRTGSIYCSLFSHVVNNLAMYVVFWLPLYKAAVKGMV